MEDRFKNYNYSAGFTLLELIVVIALITIITAVVLLNYRGIAEELALKREARDLISVFREVQSFATAVRESSSGGFPGYGINLNLTGNDKYIFFADDNDSKTYDNESEKIKEHVFKNSITIQDLCADQELATPGPCSSGGLNGLDIVLLRPDPKVYLKGNGGASEFTNDIKIILNSSSGKTKSVVFKKIGEIYVE